MQTRIGILGLRWCRWLFWRTFSQSLCWIGPNEMSLCSWRNSKVIAQSGLKSLLMKLKPLHIKYSFKWPCSYRETRLSYLCYKTYDLEDSLLSIKNALIRTRFFFLYTMVLMLRRISDLFPDNEVLQGLRLYCFNDKLTGCYKENGALWKLLLDQKPPFINWKHYNPI
jgi:hypothetical protein